MSRVRKKGPAGIPWRFKPPTGPRHAENVRDHQRMKQEWLDHFRMFMFKQLDERVGLLLPRVALGRSRDLIAPRPTDRRRKSEYQKVFDQDEMTARLVPEIRAIWDEHWGRTEKGPIDAFTLAAEYMTIWRGGRNVTRTQVFHRANQRLVRRRSL